MPAAPGTVSRTVSLGQGRFEQTVSLAESGILLVLMLLLGMSNVSSRASFFLVALLGLFYVCFKMAMRTVKPSES